MYCVGGLVPLRKIVLICIDIAFERTKYFGAHTLWRTRTRTRSHTLTRAHLHTLPFDYNSIGHKRVHM